LPEWLRGREGDAWFMLIVLIFGLVSVLGLQAIANAMSAPATPRTAQATSQPASASLPRGVVAAHEQVFHLPQKNPSLMTPAVDQQGRVWVGEMGENKLAMLDPRSGKVQAWTPPGGQYNIMAEVVDRQGAVWFTEEAANYIGRFDPTTQTFTTYPLGKVNGQSAAPEALVMDAQGRLWFTEVTGGALGRLDPATAAITTYPLPAASGGAPAYPYALTVAPDGMVWYGDLSGGAVGRVDPTTGQVTSLSVNDPKAQIYSMTVGPDGAVWFTELLTDKVGRIDPQSGQVSMVTVPATLGNPATLYDVVAHDGALWFTSTGANALVRYTVSTRQFTFYQLAQPSSVPFGLALAPDGALWFTADGAPNYIGVVHP
jgi:virginiamycin B lyase